MRYLFDTDVISILMKRGAPEALRERLYRIGRKAQAISVLTVQEICYGAYRSAHPQKFLESLECAILTRVDVLPYDDTAARIAGRIRAERELLGQPIAPADLQIAATALATGRILVTGNTRHFSNIQGLDVENWLAP